MRNKKYLKSGVASILIVYFLFAAILVFFFGVCIPFLMSMNVNIYAAGQTILTNPSVQQAINSIEDPSIKAEINETFVTAQGSIATNVNILGYFFQYGWIVIIVIIVFVMFMKTRALVETQSIV